MQIIVDSKDRRDLALNLVRNIRQDDCPMSVVVEPYIASHSDDQRGLFHATVREFSRVTGYTEGEVKEFVKQEVLGTRVIEIAGKQREVVCSSEYDDQGRKRNKVSYSELIDGLHRIAAEGGIEL